MKAQSFEHRLRHTVPPAVDPRARLLARRAALEAFERVQSERLAAAAANAANAADSAHAADAAHAADDDRSAGSAGNADSAGKAMPAATDLPRRRVSRNAWVGGFAAAGVVLVGVSVVSLVPPIDLHRTLEPPTPPVSEEAPPPVRAPDAEEKQEPPPSPPPTNAQPSQAANAQPSQPTVAQPSQPMQASKVAPPANAQATGRTASGAKATEQRPTDADDAMKSRAASTELPAPASPAQQRAVPAPNPPPAPPEQLDDVTVTGNQIERRDLASSSPVATPDSYDDALQESIVTATRVQTQRRGLFSRNKKNPAAAEGRDKFQHFETNPVKRVADDPVSTFSVDVDTASYSFVRRQLNEDDLPQADAVRVEEMLNYFDYSWPTAESREQPFKPTVTVSDSPWGEGKKLVHIGIKGYQVPQNNQPDVNLVLLLDVSGSMDQPDKLPLAVRSMELLVETLKPTDTVAIVVYAGAAGQVLAPTPVSQKATILRALNSLEPGGSTAGAEGIQLAYKLAEESFRKGGVNRILLATDGDFNVGITDQNELKSYVEHERTKGVFLSVLGFGEGNYRDEMAQTLAQNGNGVAAYIDTLAEARKVLVQQSAGSLVTIAKDVKLQVEFNPATVSEYRLVGYETRALNRQDFNNDKVDAGDVGSGHTVTAIYEITPVGSQARLIEDTRYGERAPAPVERKGKASEYGYLKIRYKLPNGFRSRLMEQPIPVDAGVPASLKADVEFSTAVAGFAQILRGGQYTGELAYEDVIQQAKKGIGADPNGYRAEFVELARKAEELAR